MNYSLGKTSKKFNRKWLFLIIAILVVGLLTWLLLKPNKANAPEKSDSQPEISQTENKEPEYAEIDLQPTVSSWLAGQSADYSIVVYDTQSKNIIASNNPDEVLFAASLYKIFVAYSALEDFQTGKQNPDEILVNGNSRKTCVDLMIRESNSPCGEAMMASIGPNELKARMEQKGIKDTYFTGIRTTATDTAEILKLILAGDDLNETSTAFLRDAMRFQDAMYKKGLQGGAPEGIWDTKVGWNEDQNYHDIGILTMPDGRVFVVSILSQGQGSSAPIANFSSTIYNVLSLPVENN
jgi:hypothetical protein